MKITLTMHDACAEKTVRTMARQYVFLCNQSRLPALTSNYPWQWQAGMDWNATHRKWIARVDKNRAAYRKSLESFIADLPPVPIAELKQYKSPRGGNEMWVSYPSSRIAEIADAYADALCAMVLESGK